MAIWRTRIACWIPKATDTHYYYLCLLPFHCNNGYANTSQHYVIRTSSVYVALWGRREMYTRFWWGSWRKWPPRRRCCTWEDNIIMRQRNAFEELWSAWCGSGQGKWQGIVRLWTHRLHTIQVICWAADELLACKDGLCPTESRCLSIIMADLERGETKVCSKQVNECGTNGVRREIGSELAIP